ncbi:hypothetical protein RND81_07G045300 [Saponaria officinalis]|uniref:Uncharacterized protein n=1 Tax=Saponaria officinalis TaxID=3572 RepID=A0AAW1JKD3_SAPOF
MSYATNQKSRSQKHHGRQTAFQHIQIPPHNIYEIPAYGILTYTNTSTQHLNIYKITAHSYHQYYVVQSSIRFNISMKIPLHRSDKTVRKKKYSPLLWQTPRQYSYLFSS